jgi:hypothetical protein
LRPQTTSFICLERQRFTCIIGIHLSTDYPLSIEYPLRNTDLHQRFTKVSQCSTQHRQYPERDCTSNQRFCARLPFYHTISEECAIMEPQSSTNTRFPPPRRVATEPTIFQAPRRSLSVSSTSSLARSGSIGGSRAPEDLVETLFNHPSVKIIAFTTSQRTSYGPSSLSNEPAPGSLLASSQLERTIAVGMFALAEILSPDLLT